MCDYYCRGTLRRGPSGKLWTELMQEMIVALTRAAGERTDMESQISWRETQPDLLMAGGLGVSSGRGKTRNDS